MNPVAPPELRMLEISSENSSIAGVYSINLTQAMPYYSDRSEDGPTGMIFRLQDLQSGNVTYIQLVHLCITACLSPIVACIELLEIHNTCNVMQSTILGISGIFIPVVVSCYTSLLVAVRSRVSVFMVLTLALLKRL